jgi:hypothetical protein
MGQGLLCGKRNCAAAAAATAFARRSRRLSTSPSASSPATWPCYSLKAIIVTDCSSRRRRVEPRGGHSARRDLPTCGEVSRRVGPGGAGGEVPGRPLLARGNAIDGPPLSSIEALPILPAQPPAVARSSSSSSRFLVGALLARWMAHQPEVTAFVLAGGLAFAAAFRAPPVGRRRAAPSHSGRSSAC